MVGLYAASNEQRLYVGPNREANMLVIVGVIIGLFFIILLLAPSIARGYLLGGVIMLAVLGCMVAVLASAARHQVARITRSGDMLTVDLLGFAGQTRPFKAPVSQFTGWRIASYGKYESIAFTYRGQRHTMPLWRATHIDFDGFATLDANLGKALASRRATFNRTR